MDNPGSQPEGGSEEQLEPVACDAKGKGSPHPVGYLGLYEMGILKERGRLLDEVLCSCTLCPRCCRADRKAGRLGACGVGDDPKVAAMSVHRWEEPPISGSRGSGTVFFSGCTLECVFCQNYPISQMGVGKTMMVEDLAKGMLHLQKKGVHNINLVSATHQMPSVVKALLLAIPQGLQLPLVYNSSGYETVETLNLLDGIVDIYLPDIKYSDPVVAKRYSGRADYVEHNRMALREMWRQVGPLTMDGDGLAVKGLMIRHLVLPEGLSGSGESFEFLAREIGHDVWLSLMRQYFPAHKAHDILPLHRKVTDEEYGHAVRLLERFSLENGYVQSCGEEDLHGAC